MDYEKILERLPDYVAGRLDPDAAEQGRVALETDAGLRREHDALRAYYDAVGSLDDVRAPGDFVDAVNRRIDSRRGLRGLVHTLFVPLPPKLPLEIVGLGVTVALVILLFNPFTLKNVPREALEQAPAVSRFHAPASPGAAPPDTGRLLEKQRSAARTPAASKRLAPPPTAGPHQPRPKPSTKQREWERSAVKEERDESRSSQGPADGAGGDDADADTPQAGKATGGTLVAAAPPSPVEPKPRTMKKAEKAPASPPPTLASSMASLGAETEASADRAAAERAAEETALLERRKLRAASEAVSVMTLTVDERDIDRGDVARGRRSRERENAGPRNEDGEFRSVADKVYHLVERVISKHGGRYTIRSTVTTPRPQRVYVVTVPRTAFDPIRAELVELGALKDIDLNLDATEAERVTFRLAVRVDD